MATIKNGLLGTYSGKIGNLVFCQRHNMTYIRSVASVENRKPPSQAQKMWQRRFQLIQKQVSAALPYVRIGFHHQRNGSSAHNAAMSYNLKHAVMEINNECVIKWDVLSFSRDLPNPIKDLRFTYKPKERTIQLSWTCKPQTLKKLKPYGLKSAVMICSENCDYETCQGLLYGEPIEKKEQIVSFQPEASPERYHIYLAFFSTDSSQRSTNATYVGSFMG